MQVYCLWCNTLGLTLYNATVHLTLFCHCCTREANKSVYFSSRFPDGLSSVNRIAVSRILSHEFMAIQAYFKSQIVLNPSVLVYGVRGVENLTIEGHQSIQFKGTTTY
jgi:hypothetical protein